MKEGRRGTSAKYVEEGFQGRRKKMKEEKQE